ncbi:Fc.00g079400.m01.CDS01 [Cosmosporella sp. VM-42]
MSFGVGVGDFLAVIKLVHRVRSNYSNAPSQFKAISEDVRGLSFILLDAEACCDRLSDAQLETLQTTVSTCFSLLHEVEAILNKYSELKGPAERKVSKASRIWKRLTWEPEDVRDLRSRITTQVSILDTLSSQIIRRDVAKLVVDNRKVGKDVATLVSRQDDNQRLELLKWISEVDYASKQNDLVSCRQPGSRKWLFNSKQYLRWFTEKGIILFCPGIPGAGKTITMAVVIEDLQLRSSNDAETITIFVYCSYQNRDQTVDKLLCSLLRSALQQRVEIPHQIISLFNARGVQPSVLSREKVLELIQLSFSGAKRVNVLIDALDELPSEVRQPFTSDLLELHTGCGVNLFLTSREIPSIQRPFTDHGSLILEIRASDEDVQAYLEEHSYQLPNFVSQVPGLQQEIIDVITEASGGMFLLAELHLRSLKGKKSPRALRTSLSKLLGGSNAYDAAYQEAMSRIESQDSDSETLAKQALLIIACSRRPLMTEELAYALSIEPDSDFIDEENVPDIDEVVDVCAGLMKVDVQSNIIRLVHKSTQEYFERNKSRWFPDANSRMATLCTQYLALLKSRSSDDQPADAFPFADYARVHWAYHQLLAAEKHNKIDEAILTERSISQAPPHASKLELMQLVKELSTTKQVLVNSCASGNYGTVELLLSTSACKEDLNGGSKRLGLYADMEYDYDVSQESMVTWRNTLLNDDVPLTIAAFRRDIPMMQLLLRHGADPNIRSAAEQTALYIGATYGFPDVVALLLDQGDIDQELTSLDISTIITASGTEQWLRATALEACAIRGDLICCKLLVDSAEPDIIISALEGATKNGHVEVCKLLLVRVNPEAVQYVLSVAAQDGHLDIVIECLKWSGGKVETNALSHAIGARHTSIAAILVPSSDRKYRNSIMEYPLRLAFHRKLYEIMQQLLLYDDVQAEEELENGRLIVDAILSADVEAVRILTPYANINADIGRLPEHSQLALDIKETTLGEPIYPLHFAAMVSNSAITETLLTRKDIEVDCLDCLGRSPFLIAVEKGHDQVVKALIGSTTGVRVDRIDHDFKTAYDYLLPNSSNGELFRLLHGSSHFDVNQRDPEGFTLLHRICRRLPEADFRKLDDDDPIYYGWAFTEYDAVGLVEAMLDVPELDVNARDRAGNSPLFWAIRSGQRRTVTSLLSHKKISLNVATSPGVNPLFLVYSDLLIADLEFPYTEDGYVRGRYSYSNLEVFREFCEDPRKRKDDDEIFNSILDYIFSMSNLRSFAISNRSSSTDATKICRSSKEANQAEPGVLELLVRFPNEQDEKGRTLLFQAVERNNLHAVRRLLSHPNIDVNLADGFGRTPLYYAIDCGSFGAAQLLLSSADIDMGVSNHRGDTPLLRSVTCQDARFMRLLLTSPDIDTNVQNRDGETPLIKATGPGGEILELLAQDPRVDPNLKDYDGLTPLLHAMTTIPALVAENTKIILSIPGLDVDICDNEGGTPFSYFVIMREKLGEVLPGHYDAELREIFEMLCKLSRQDGPRPEWADISDMSSLK